MSVSKDICNIKKIKESITAHKLCVAILIRQFCLFRESAMKPIHRRDFCILILKLIQSPDITLPQLRELLLAGKYNIEPRFMEKFDHCLKDLYIVGVGYLLDLAEYISRLTIDLQLNGIWCQINKNSILGCYLRRLMVFFDKLTFAQVTAIYEEFKEYFKPCQDEILNREPYTPKTEFNKQSTDDAKCSDQSIMWYTKSDQWSRKQAELFIATQAALLSTNEREAQPPVELHKQIRNLLKSNPDLAEAHFLSYLNYLRVREFCGAIDSIFHSFDRSASTVENKSNNVDEKSKGFRYAALNLAALYVQFGHKEEALAALKESIMMAQEANDNICLQYALMWMYKLTTTNKELLIEHSILKSTDLNLTYIASIGVQAYTQYAGFSGGNPKQIFETMTKSDVLNSQHTYRDLMANSYAAKASLWLAYGKAEMWSMWSQALLHLNTDNLSLGKAYSGEGTCQAVCAAAAWLAREGRHHAAESALKCARAAFPHEPLSHGWMRAEALATCERATLHGDWARAADAAAQLAAADPFESRLRLAELHLAKADYETAAAHVNHVIDHCHQEQATTMAAHCKVRAMLMLAELQSAAEAHSVASASVLTILNSALAMATLYHLDYLCSIIHLHIASVHLTMGMTAQALKLLDTHLVRVLSHGSRYDRARAMLLHVKCLVAHAAHADRYDVLLEATDILSKVKDDFHEVEARSRVKDVLYLQAQLYNELEHFEDRNNCALEYKQYVHDYPTKNSRTLVTSF